MTSFAFDLAQRLTTHEAFWSALSALQSVGVARTLTRDLSVQHALAEEELMKLLYCADVFSQTESDPHRALAQSIAINTLLSGQGESLSERCLSVLTELGNFPGLDYTHRHFSDGDTGLLAGINRGVSKQLNSVQVGEHAMALTDYQKEVWDRLPHTRALAVTAPTSAGKSFLVLEHMCRLAEQRLEFRAVYLAPTRALLSEVHQKIQHRLQGRADIRVSTVPSLDPEQRIREIFILTQERLHVLLSAWGDKPFHLIVVDEAQNIADAARGMILQDCLERIMRREEGTQIVLLAPGAVGLPQVARTMGIKDVVPASTSVSPVLQNRIVLTKVKYRQKELDVHLLRRAEERIYLGRLALSRGLVKANTRLAAVALELGGTEGSLVYETGPREAEKTAALLMNGLQQSQEQHVDADLEELSTFIKDHIHPDYQLASMVRHGVAYHYGRMPSLLREAIEASFKRKGAGLHFLVCTTTLAQGINLPARNVFIDTPKRGHGVPLDPALLWNFAGRAGRLNQDIVGNVFLLDDDSWSSQPMDQFVPFSVESAVTQTLESSFEEVAEALRGRMPKLNPFDAKSGQVRACAGLLIARAASAQSREFLQKVLPERREDHIELLAAAAEQAVSAVGLPTQIVAENWTIDPFGLSRLYQRILRKIAAGEIDELIPTNPHEAPYELYPGIFSRIVDEVLERNPAYGGLVANLAIPWMKGVPYPVILKNWIARQRKSETRKADAAVKEGRKPAKPASVDSLIYRAFELIEDAVRFQFVQLGKAYLDLLLLALRETGHQERIADVYDFALALELGVATQTGTALVELGLSRISACVIEGLLPDSSLNVAQARTLLESLDVEANNLSPVIVGELERLGLRAAA